MILMIFARAARGWALEGVQILFHVQLSNCPGPVFVVAMVETTSVSGRGKG
jgi:hypothetical protein